jgi:predicted metal-binding protein
MPYTKIKLNQIVFDSKVQTYCNNPKFKCPNYGHSHACPPVAPYLEKEVSNFRDFYLIYYKFDLDGYIKDEKIRHPKRSKEKILNYFYRKNFLRDHLEEEVHKFLIEYQGKFNKKLVLWDGFCRICYKENKHCTYDSGEPCRYQPRYSMEAIGINVDKTVKNADFEMEWPPLHFAYRFGLICLK